jgi:hypothetical protein
MDSAAIRAADAPYFREYVAPLFPNDDTVRFYALWRDDLDASLPRIHGRDLNNKAGYRGHRSRKAAERCAGERNRERSGNTGAARSCSASSC